MDAFIANIQENAILYGCLAACTTPLIYLTRKYSVPAILYLVEFVIYACVMHVVVYLIVGGTRWFKESSSMKALRDDGKPEDTPEWGTPLIEFWETVDYDPQWLWKAEIFCLILILLAMWRYRPMKIQRKSGRQTQDFSSSGAKGKKQGSYSAGNRGKGGPAKGARGRRGR